MPDEVPTISAARGFPQLLGLRLVETDQEQVVGEVEARGEHTNGTGSRVHGGFLMAIADTLGAVGTVLNLPPDHVTSTIESKTNFLAAAKPGRLRGVATPVHIGRTTQVWRTDISDSTGRLIATITQTQIVLPGVAAGAEKLSPPAEEAARAKPDAGESIPDQRRRQIFEAASDVFGRKGYANTSVRDIAEAAAMAVPTMYQYLRSKEDILSLVFETYMHEIGRTIKAAADSETDPIAKLRAAIEANLVMYDKYRRQIRLMYQETRSLGADNQARALELTRASNQVWETVIRDGIAAGVFETETPEIAANLIPMICATWVLRRWNLNGADFDTLKSSVVDFVLRALSVSSAPGTSSRPSARRAAQ